MNILVTGANGQLGNEIRELAASYLNMQFAFIDVEDLDLTNRNKVIKYFGNNSFDYVINCAAYTAVDKAETDEKTAYRVNAEAVGLLAEVTSGTDTRLIHISTDYVFDGDSNKPYTENHTTNPLSVYGRSKLEGERLLMEIDPDSIIIRTAWLYSGFGNNFLKTMIKLGKERDELRVVFDQTGTPTYAADLAEAVLTIIEKVEAGKVKLIPGIYHYTNEGVTSWYDFAYHILKISNINCNIVPVTSEEFPAPAPRPAYSVLSKKKIRETYDLNIPHWYDSLIRMLSK